MEKPLFSVVMPAFNSSSFIEESIRSVSLQSLKMFELIVVDDDSSDNTLEIAKESIKRFGVVGTVVSRSNARQRGVSTCRNLGIELSQGDWICFLDSDDLFTTDKLARTYEHIKKYGSDIFAYHHSARNFDDVTKETLCFSRNGTLQQTVDILPELLKLNIIVTSTVTLRRELLIQLGGFNTALNGVEDYMLWLRTAKKSKWHFDPLPMTDYRVRHGSLMKGRKLSHYVTQNHALLKEARAYNEFTPVELRKIERYFFDDVMQYYSSECINDWGWKYFLRGLIKLYQIGKGNLASRLFLKQARFAVLKTLSKIKR